MKYLIILFLFFSLSFSGCDYLDAVPEKDIQTVETIFETRSSADSWITGLYGQILRNTTDWGVNVSFFGADEFTAGIATMDEPYRKREYRWQGFKVAEGLQMSQEPYGNVWDKGKDYEVSYYATIRSCNVFLDNIDRVYNMKEIEKKQWGAEVKALKAYLYFELVRHYGPIVLVPHNLDVAEDSKHLQQPRAHVDTCFKAIVNLLDEAIEDGILPLADKPVTRRAYFSKESVLAFKARVLLYAASPLFNGNAFYSDFRGKNGEPLFSAPPADPEKWRFAAEAADEAVRECENAGYGLYMGGGGQGSELLNHMYNVENSVHGQFKNSEILLEWKDGYYFELILPLLDANGAYGNHWNQNARGAVSPSMKMVEMYYTENGLPIDVDNTWNYSNRYKMARETDRKYLDVVERDEDVLQLHLRREPRFYANIAADRTYWQRGPAADDNLLVEARKGEEFGMKQDIISSTDHQNMNGYYLKKFLYSNIGTQAYESGDNETTPIIRMAELYMIQAEAWNEYEGPSNKVYDPSNKVRKRAGILDIQTAWKSYSRDPGRIDSKVGMRQIIQQEWNIEFAFEGHRFWNVRRWLTATEELNHAQLGWNVLGTTAEQFYNHYQGPGELPVGKCKFTAPRDYLFPIKAEEVLISSVVQNPGW